ncbi:MAG: choice-of-anchor J domain-containing protein, partial [Bacteroidales bacterium]|nr:choice-of-anchor J domain-containing protein [Bacteroidales bacterium]
MKDYYNSEDMKTTSVNMEHARTSKDANGLVKSVSGLYQVCIRSVFGRNQGRTNAVPRSYQRPTKALSTPYQGRINALFSYSGFRRMMAAFALVAMMAMGNVSWGQQVTVANGTSTNSYVPMYTYYCDYGFTSEYIIPASQLTALPNGSVITAITLYQSSPAAWVANNLTIKLSNTGTTAYSANGLLGNGGTTVYTNTSYSANSASEHTFNFNVSSFTYTGGSIIVQISATSGGTYKSSSWYGVSQSTYQGYYTYNSSNGNSNNGSRQQFIPKTTFTYTTNSSEADCEGFEGVSGTAYNAAGNMPTGWFSYTTATGTNIVKPHVTSGNSYNYYHSGSQSINMESGTNANNTAYVVMPKNDDCPTNATISFWYRHENAGYGTLDIGYVTAQTAAGCAGFVRLKTMAAVATLTQETVDLSDYTVPSNAYIAFRWVVTNGGYWACGIDDVCVSCPAVTSTCDESFDMSDGLTRTIACGSTYCFYDDGGKNGPYNHINGTQTATFTSAGNININFSMFEHGHTYTQANYDYLTIWDGPVGTGTKLAFGSAEGQTTNNGATYYITPGQTYTCTSGTMTVVWAADDGNTEDEQYAGWAAEITAENCCTTPRTLTISGQSTITSTGSTTLTATTNHSASGDVITWHSSDNSVASVNSSGEVTAHHTGTVTITAVLEVNGIYCVAVATKVITVTCASTFSAQCFDFEDYATPSDSKATDSGLPDCWDRIFDNPDNMGCAPHIYNGTSDALPCEGNNAIIMSAASQLTTTSTVIMPEISGLTSGYQVSFESCINASGTLSLGYITGGTTFTALYTPTLTTSCASYSYTLTSSLPSGARLAFRFTNTGYDIQTVSVDNICIIAPPCDDPDTAYVGDYSQNETNQYLPSFNYYNYSLTQQIYEPCEIGKTGNITSIAFYNEGAVKTRTYDIYLVNTNRTAFTSTTDWMTVTDANRVFRGEVTMAANTWTVIGFDTPFAYTGNNLAVIIDDNSGAYTGAPHMACRVYPANGNQAIRVYSDGTNYDPSSPGSYTGTQETVKNQLKFSVCEAVDMPSSYTVTVSASPAAGGEVGVSNKCDNFTVTATPNNCYRFVNWTENGTQVSTDATYSFTATSNRTLVANFEEYNVSITSDPNPLTCLASGTEVVLTVSTDILIDYSLAGYTFSTGTDASRWYNVTNTTNLITSSGDSYASALQNIGFTFPFGGTDYTQFSVNSDGNLRLGQTVTGTGSYYQPFSSTSANDNSPKINGFGFDGYFDISNYGNYVHMQVFGTAPNRVLVVEFNESSYSSTYRQYPWKWQVQLFENGTVQMVYASTAPASYGIDNQVGLCVNVNDGWTVSTTTHQATHFTNGTSTQNAGASSWPGINRWYRFTPPSPYVWTYTGTEGTADGETYRVSPTQNSTYTVSVTGGGCTKSEHVDVTINKDFTIGNIAAQAICAGGTTTLNPSITGGNEPFTYKWYKGSTLVSTSTTTSSYSTPTSDATLGATNHYTIKVTDACGTEKEKEFTVNVYGDITIGDIAAQTICAGGSATLAPTISGGKTPYASYAWYKDGGSTPVATTATYTTPAGDATFGASHTYTIKVTDGCGTVKQKTFTVNVYSDITIGDIAAQTICAGGSATLAPTISGGKTPYASYAW